ncbi:MAG: hypothetical protein ACYCYE_15840 [Clostridia bacterium]
MEKRTDQKKQRSVEFKHKLQKVSAVFFCIALLVFFINATDISTRRMIMCNDDKYAMAVSLQKDNLLRLDIAGEKYLLNIEPVIRVADTVVSNSKRCYESIVKAIKAKMGV